MERTGERGGTKNLCDLDTHLCVERELDSDCTCPLPLQLPCCTQAKACTCSLLVCP